MWLVTYYKKKVIQTVNELCDLPSQKKNLNYKMWLVTLHYKKII
jgi:hypothetical protein